ncbi:hypothetical protein AALP_AA8G052200 [Arabis alpina]|uniref:Maternal effect embryo arrest 60 n=1 Tax=Arabis alpina TaxID=50452 RepID=A0A087G538_ARAAL|nr:hypothetical protein AALP_AA8G052200 [Arabis alpina]
MTTSIHITALDGIVNVNSLFTLAVFIGLAWNPTDPSNSLVTNPNCNPTSQMAENLVSFHVFSFASFLFSSLIALGLKQAMRLNIGGSSFHHFSTRIDPVVYYVNKTALRIGMVVSGLGSVCGCGFLMMALINVVQIKLGSLGCGDSGHSYAAIVPLLILVPTALFIYVSLMLYAFTR